MRLSQEHVASFFNTGSGKEMISDSWLEKLVTNERRKVERWVEKHTHDFDQETAIADIT